MRRQTASPAGRLRQSGTRLHRGPWTLFVGPCQAPPGRLIVSLGKRTGAAVVRSRIRRIARDVYRGLVDELRMYDVLLAAREDVSTHPRRDLRVTLARIFQRATTAEHKPPGSAAVNR